MIHIGIFFIEMLVANTREELAPFVAVSPVVSNTSPVCVQLRTSVETHGEERVWFLTVALVITGRGTLRVLGQINEGDQHQVTLPADTYRLILVAHSKTNATVMIRNITVIVGGCIDDGKHWIYCCYEQGGATEIFGTIRIL